MNWYNLKEWNQARYVPQFDTLQNIEDSCMHYEIKDITNATFLGLI